LVSGGPSAEGPSCRDCAHPTCKELLTLLPRSCKELFTGRRIVLENNLKAIREGRGWSQGELARRLGVSRQTINAVETDKYDPSLPLALRMSKLFGVAVPELFVDHWEPGEE
jgi:putative transcriptional regulator